MALVGERKALAAAVLAFFTSVFGLNALVGPPELGLLFGGMAGIYGVAFFGVVAGWFWARWYATGVALSGLGMAAVLAFKVGLLPIVWIWGGAHGLVFLCLVGTGAAAAFDGRLDWRERFRLDENAAARLGKAVQRAGASLPYLVMAGLAPKQSFGAGGAIALVSIGVAAFGLRALVRLRSWGVLALAGAGALALVGGLWTTGPALVRAASTSFAFDPWGAALVATALLAAACTPFVGPCWRFLRAR